MGQVVAGIICILLAIVLFVVGCALLGVDPTDIVDD